MSDNVKEICEKLRKTYNLWCEKGKAQGLRASLDREEASAIASLTSNTNNRIKSVVASEEDKVKPHPSLPKSCFAEPSQRPGINGCKTEKDVMMAGVYGLLMYLGIVVLLLGLLLSVGGSGLSVIILFLSVAGCIALIRPWCEKGRKMADILTYEQRCKEYEENIARWKESLDSTMTDEERISFYAECCDFDMSFLGFLKSTLNSIRALVDEHNENKHSLILEYEKKKKDMDQRVIDLENELESIGIISKNYYYLSMDVADVLENGRADTLKEALNIAIDDERKEKEAAERRAEALRQEEILRSRAEEEMRHNQAMEYEARQQTEYTKRSQEEAERHNREVEKNMRDWQNRSR